MTEVSAKLSLPGGAASVRASSVKLGHLLSKRKNYFNAIKLKSKAPV
jgi:hypothetical protein